MRLSSRRLVLAAVLFVPAALFALDAYAQRGGPPPAPRPGPTPPNPGVPGGQPRPPGPNVPQPGTKPQQPNANQPQVRYVTVWSCSNCGRELGRGDTPPAVAVCPGCGANFTPVSTRLEVPNSTSSSRPSDSPMVLIVIAAGVGALLVGFLLAVCLRKRRPAPADSDFERHGASRIPEDDTYREGFRS
jgi:hypothetical protein